MTTIVLLGGNGYIGRNVTKNWLKKIQVLNFTFYRVLEKMN